MGRGCGETSMPIEECPSCHAPMPARAVYCPRCGRRRGDEVQAAGRSRPLSVGALAARLGVAFVLAVEGIVMNRSAAAGGETVAANIGLVLATVGVLAGISALVDYGNRRCEAARTA